MHISSERTRVELSGQLGLCWGGGILGLGFEGKTGGLGLRINGGVRRLGLLCKGHIEAALRWRTRASCCGGLLTSDEHSEAYSSLYLGCSGLCPGPTSQGQDRIQ